MDLRRWPSCGVQLVYRHHFPNVQICVYLGVLFVLSMDKFLCQCRVLPRLWNNGAAPLYSSDVCGLLRSSRSEQQVSDEVRLTMLLSFSISLSVKPSKRSRAKIQLGHPQVLSAPLMCFCSFSFLSVFVGTVSAGWFSSGPDKHIRGALKTYNYHDPDD